MDNNSEELANILKDRSPYVSNLHKKTRGWNSVLLITGLATTIGSANVAGYNIGIINAPSSYMKAWMNETLISSYKAELSMSGIELLWSFVVSIFLVGGAIGSLGGSYVADRIGRKASYLTCAVLFAIGALCFQFCRALSSIELLILGRILVGLASGMTTTCLPLYLTEIAPLPLRGVLGVFVSVGITSGVVVAQVFSLQQVLGTEDLWHYCLSFQLVFVFFCSIFYWKFPESPKYLYLMNDRSAALVELKKLCDDSDMAKDELNLMDNLRDSNEDNSQCGVLQVLKDPKLLLPLILVCAMQGGQQLSGINAVFYYSVSIFQAIGFSKSNAEWANLGAGFLNLVISFFTPALMKHVNRRPLMLVSCFGCGVFLSLLGIFYGSVESSSLFPSLCVVALLSYISFYQIGIGPIPFFCGSELFDVAPRSAAMAMGSLSSWFCNFLVGMTFPTLKNSMGAGVFAIFACSCFLLTIFLKRYMPETRGKDISEVAQLVSKGFKSRPLHVSQSRSGDRIYNEIST